MSEHTLAVFGVVFLGVLGVATVLAIAWVSVVLPDLIGERRRLLVEVGSLRAELAAIKEGRPYR